MKTRVSIFAVVSAILAVGSFTQSVYAGPNGLDDLIVVDHPPTQVGGLSSDTELRTMFGTAAWQRGADDFVLTSSTQIGAIRWWGFYDQDNPPAQETFRIRFYAARDTDGLPDDSEIIYQQIVDSNTRIATGRQVFVGVDPAEYVYNVELALPVLLAANTTYWLEIVQLNDLNTHFRWEFSQADANGQAFINAVTVDWRLSLPVSADTAYQLIAVPEPAAGSLLFLIVAVAAMRRKRATA